MEDVDPGAGNQRPRSRSRSYGGSRSRSYSRSRSRSYSRSRSRSYGGSHGRSRAPSPPPVDSVRNGNVFDVPHSNPVNFDPDPRPNESRRLSLRYLSDVVSDVVSDFESPTLVTLVFRASLDGVPRERRVPYLVFANVVSDQSLFRSVQRNPGQPEVFEFAGDEPNPEVTKFLLDWFPTLMGASLDNIADHPDSAKIIERTNMEELMRTLAQMGLWESKAEYMLSVFKKVCYNRTRNMGAIEAAGIRENLVLDFFLFHASVATQYETFRNIIWTDEADSIVKSDDYLHIRRKIISAPNCPNVQREVVAFHLKMQELPWKLSDEMTKKLVVDGMITLAESYERSTQAAAPAIAN